MAPWKLESRSRAWLRLTRLWTPTPKQLSEYKHWRVESWSRRSARYDCRARNRRVWLVLGSTQRQGRVELLLIDLSCRHTGTGCRCKATASSRPWVSCSDGAREEQGGCGWSLLCLILGQRMRSAPLALVLLLRTCEALLDDSCHVDARRRMRLLGGFKPMLEDQLLGPRSQSKRRPLWWVPAPLVVTSCHRK